MLDRIQFLALDSCADDYELFYFPFAHVNFGGQIYSGRSDPGQEPGRFKDDRPSWPIHTTAPVVAAALEELVRLGFLSWRRWEAGVDHDQPFLTSAIPPEEMQVYEGYDCVTFEDHLARHGYGPHEFYITPRGVEEVQRPEYEAYLES